MQNVHAKPWMTPTLNMSFNCGGPPWIQHLEKAKIRIDILRAVKSSISPPPTSSLSKSQTSHGHLSSPKGVHDLAPRLSFGFLFLQNGRVELLAFTAVSICKSFL